MALLKRSGKPQGWRFLACAVCVISAFTAGNPFWSEARAQDSLEYEVKAAYLVKFAPFINWPDNAFSSPSAPVVICVAGHDPFGALLDRAVAGQRDGDRAMVVRRTATPDANCQILFAGGSPGAVESELAAEKGRPVVTVTDSDGPIHGIISFTLNDNHVRFDIDEAAAEAASIRISSKLLDLAHVVNKRAQP